LVKSDTSNEYLENIRAVHDPSLHLKTLEDELRGTMGKALGRQGQKIMKSLRCMQQHREKYEKILLTLKEKRKEDESFQFSTLKNEMRETANLYNKFREQAKVARWELIVHRQAIGFIVNNHDFVIKKFPIGEPLPIDEESNSTQEGNTWKQNKAKDEIERNFTGQLDWWQRIGRWR